MSGNSFEEERIKCFSELKGLNPDFDFTDVESNYPHLDKVKAMDLAHYYGWKVPEEWSKKSSSEKNSQKEEVLSLILQNQKSEATELIVNLIKSENKIYTIREDKGSPEMYIYENGVYVAEGLSRIKEIVRQILGTNYTTNFANQIIAKIEADTFIDKDVFFFDRNPFEIPLENGILNLQTKELGGFDKNKFFFNKLPIYYDKTATCDEIQKFFQAILPDESDILVVQELFGYVLLKKYPIAKAFMFHGDGRNGKGVLLRLIKAFVGYTNVTNIPLQDLEGENNFHLSNLHKKLVNISADLDSRSLRFSGRLKSLTGEDHITAPRKFMTPLEFVNYSKMIFACNELPLVYDKTLAFWNRWIYLNFPYTFLSEKELSAFPEEERKNFKLADRQLFDKLVTKGEMSGLLNWALEGLSRIFKKGDFTYNKTTVDVQREWIRKSNSFSAFLDDCTESSYEGWVKKEDLQRAYNEYCKFYKLKQVSARLMKNELSPRGVIDGRKLLEENGNKSQKAIWEGIKLVRLGNLDTKKQPIQNFPKNAKGEKRSLSSLPLLNTPKINSNVEISDTESEIQAILGGEYESS